MHHEAHITKMNQMHALKDRESVQEWHLFYNKQEYQKKIFRASDLQPGLIQSKLGLSTDQEPETGTDLANQASPVGKVT